MTYFSMMIPAMLTGIALDLVIGDPEGWPHPVIWIGRWISFAEKRLRKRGGDLRRSAVILTVSTVTLAALASAAVLYILYLLHPMALFAGMTLLSWWSLSAKCLAKEARGVMTSLSMSLDEGRSRLKRIVGRDTDSLSREEVICAAVETVAENTTDGVIAPMLYLAVGGPVLAAAFKAASTLDSMVGYLDERYRDIGWSSARLDDALNFVPARICGPLICLGAGIFGLDAKNAWRIMLRDHSNHLSPNCAWSEAAAAGALGIRLGGTHAYFGKLVEKPSIGDALRLAEPEDISRTCAMMYAAEFIFAALIFAIWVIS